MRIVSLSASFLLILLCVLCWRGQRLAALDGPAVAWEDSSPDMHERALRVDALAEPKGAVVVLAALAVLALVVRRPRGAALAVAGPAVAVAVTSSLKPIVGRTIHGANLSFPSGHVAFASSAGLVFAATLAGVLALSTRRALLLVAVCAGGAGVVMGWSQVVLSAHYPTDALGGFCVALATVTGCATLIDAGMTRVVRWSRRRESAARAG